MTNEMFTQEPSQDTESDLVELEFTPMSPEETVNIGDRDYLFGTHTDVAVRPT